MDAGNVHFGVRFELDAEEDERKQSRLLVHVRFPPTYPEEAPCIELKDSLGVSSGQLGLIGKFIDEQVAENMGSAMVYDILEGVKELLGNFLNGEAEVVETDVQKESKVDQVRKYGTPVTKENFAAWKAAFNAEMAAKRPPKTDRETGLTGREMFEKDNTLFTNDLELDADANVADMSVREKQTELKIDNSLFTDDVDLDAIEIESDDDDIAVAEPEAPAEAA